MKMVMMLEIECSECGGYHNIPMDYEENQYCDCGELLAGIGGFEEYKQGDKKWDLV